MALPHLQRHAVLHVTIHPSSFLILKQPVPNGTGCQHVEKPLFKRIRPSVGGGVGSNALNALQGKAFSERSEDFSAAQRRESNGIFSQLVKKFLMR